MAIKTIFIYTFMVSFLTIFSASAEQIDTNMAQMHAMDKITGRVSIIEVPVGGEVKFGTFSVVIRSCKTNAEGEVPENYAFVDVTDKSFDAEEFNIFKGWMISSSPAVNAVEHPIYDVWLLKCFNSEKEITNLLSKEQLAQRDNLPRLQEVIENNKAQETNTLVDKDPINITFKDSMYKEEKIVKNKSQDNSEQEKSDSPLNLLNIDEDFDNTDEEMIEIPANEFSNSISTEAHNLEVEKQEIIDDELSAAIDRELAKHNN